MIFFFIFSYFQAKVYLNNILKVQDFFWPNTCHNNAQYMSKIKEKSDLMNRKAYLVADSVSHLIIVKNNRHKNILLLQLHIKLQLLQNANKGNRNGI